MGTRVDIPRRAEELLPHDVDAEEAVLGSLLLDSEDMLPLVRELLHPEDFYRERNASVYAACLAVARQDLAVDQISVASHLMAEQRLDDIGGPAYLSYLVSRVPTPLFGDHYAVIVRDLAVKRRLIDIGAAIAGFGYQAMHSSEALGRSRALLDSLIGRADARTFVHIADLLARRSEHVQHVATGHPKLDQVTQGGLPRASLSVLAGETTVGKTAYALSLCRGAAARGAHVGIVTLEMSEAQLTHRLKFAAARVDSYNIRPEDTARLEQAAQELRQWDIWIYDPRGRPFVEIEAAVVAHNLRQGLDLLLYDYIGLESGIGGESESLRRASVVRALRGMGKEIDAAVLAISPLSRPGLGKAGKLSRLAWTSELEYHPDMVMFLEPEIDTLSNEPVPNRLVLDIVKQRTGRAGVKLSLSFDKATQRVSEL